MTYNDIALVRMNRGVEAEDNVQPCKIPACDNNIKYLNQEITLVGFGLDMWSGICKHLNNLISKIG